MGRLEGQHLIMLGQGRFEFRERRAAARRDDELGRIVRDDAPVGARIEYLSLKGLAVPVLGAGAAQAQRPLVGSGGAYALRPMLDDLVTLHGFPLRCVVHPVAVVASSFDCTGRLCAGKPRVSQGRLVFTPGVSESGQIRMR